MIYTLKAMAEALDVKLTTLNVRLIDLRSKKASFEPRYTVVNGKALCTWTPKQFRAIKAHFAARPVGPVGRPCKPKKEDSNG